LEELNTFEMKIIAEVSYAKGIIRLKKDVIQEAKNNKVSANT